ncbi:DUF6412 domain-containing protein [Actinomadura sp. K4S16]|uniref:DUF6412 domain-containing protein n=1 Tax=Actinomadura sp. K4S16 TaxID=1316147 RepID=UPI0011EFBB43|nr:DUF6412 domain-containing protein [Actinomadura sp. K4S16]
MGDWAHLAVTGEPSPTGKAPFVLWSLLIALLLRGFAVAEWAGTAPGQSVLATLGALTVAGLLVLAAVRVRAARQGHGAARARVRTTLRERTLRTAFLPQRDPDAAGRPRPRAPGTGIAAA